MYLRDCLKCLMIAMNRRTHREAVREIEGKGLNRRWGSEADQMIRDGEDYFSRHGWTVSRLQTEVG